MKKIDDIKKVMDRMHDELASLHVRINDKLEAVNTEIRKEADALMNDAAGVMFDLATMSQLLSNMEDQLSAAGEAENQAEWPQFGDKYWMIDDDGLAISKFFNSSTACKRRLLGGNCHRTEMKAIKADKWKMSSRTQARRMVEMCEGFYAFSGIGIVAQDEKVLMYSSGDYDDGGIRFNSTENASLAIEKLGEPLIKVALGVIDGEEAEKIVRDAMMMEWK